MAQKKNLVKKEAGDLPEITIKKSKIGGETEYLLSYGRVSIWCKSYEISDESIMCYSENRHAGYIANIFIKKEKIKECLSKFI